MPPPARTTALAAVAAVLLATSGCSESEGDRRDAYCAQVKKDAPGLTRAVDEGGAGAFIDALPTLRGLASKAPSDLKDEWQTLVNALDGLKSALEETGVSPDDITGGNLPKDLSREDRRTVRGAASVLSSEEVVTATQGIEQHALDICKQPLL